MRARAPTRVRARVCGRRCACVRARAPLHLPFSDGPLLILFQFHEKKGAMFLLDWEARSWVFLSLPPSPPLPGSALLRVRSRLLSRDPLLGFPEKGPGTTAGLSCQNDELLFLSALYVPALTGRTKSRSTTLAARFSYRFALLLFSVLVVIVLKFEVLFRLIRSHIYVPPIY